MAKTRPERLLWQDNIFDIAKEVKAPVTALAANPAALDAPKGCSEISDPETVYPDKPCAHLIGNFSGVRLLAITDATKTIVSAVREFNGFLVARKCLQCQYRTEDLVLDDFITLLNASEHCGLQVLRTEGMSSTAPQELCAAGNGAVDITKDALNLTGVDDWPHFRGLVPWISHPQVLDDGSHARHESIRNRSMD
jgi:hypothetical protein